ncbi:helix-turn-helix domain-containing protein [Saccharopolyspora griseoalba]|uniref:Helix-turn-helix domain-containing protein n=1 Tax=Saccharopolyspora griseoalba TaxID=1431848 RepID=A0ABW2LT28_9PSEU
MDSQVLPQVEPPNLAAWSGEPVLMGTAHQHDDLELNLVSEGGAMLYLFGGQSLEVGPGSVTAFWAGVPHQLVANEATRAHWVHVPFSALRSWGLPDALVGRLLSGAPLVSPPSGSVEADVARFEQWALDLASGARERREIATLELEARIRRLALSAPGEPGGGRAPVDRSLQQVIAMVQYLARNFREPVAVADVAEAAQLHPNYAMTQFRKVVRTTVVDYLTKCRLAEARRLLITTDLPVNDVGLAAGFGSVSRFYRAFTSACGTPPARFRREFRGRA